jgi:hypothetical protein
MLYLPSFRRSAHQADVPAPSFSYRPYTPEPMPYPTPLPSPDPNVDLTTKTTPHNHGTGFMSPYSSPHLTPATSKQPRTILTRLTKNAHCALLVLSALTLVTALTILGLAGDMLHQYRSAQSVPHRLQPLPTNLDTTPTIAVLGSAALVAVLNAAFLVVSILQIVRHALPVLSAHRSILLCVSPSPRVLHS